MSCRHALGHSGRRSVPGKRLSEKEDGTPDAGTGRGDRRPSIFTIPPGISFVESLAAGIRRRVGDEPVALSAVRVLVPTRRAARALALAFLRQSGGAPLLLPRLTPIGDVDEDDLLLDTDSPGDEPGDDALAGDELAIPPAIPPLRRQLLLMRLARAMRRVPTDQATLLARELARLIDQVYIERIDPGQLDALVPDEFAEHWQHTLRFLAILRDRWPGILAEHGAIDPGDRHHRLLTARAEAWRRRPPAGLVVVAGSTGTVPAAADLMATVLTLPRGLIVLPGLDREANDDVWATILEQPGHPQHGMARLLARLSVDRREVGDWPDRVISPYAHERALTERTRAINLAMRPAECAAEVRDAPPIAHIAFDDVTRIDAATPEEEARAIALVMRQTLDLPGKTAALVTPDRALGRRVAGELARWGIAIDDSGGQPLAETPPGVFLRLVAAMVGDGFAPVPLLACLKHPLAALGFSTAGCRKRARALERRVLRGPRPAAGLEGLASAVAANFATGEPLEPRGDPRPLLAALDRATEPLRRAMAPTAGAIGLDALIAAHVTAGERLAASDQETGPARLWATDAGQAMAEFIAEARDAAEGIGLDDPATYPDLFDILLAGRVIRPRYGRHPRLAIWGVLEARLQHADVMILGGLNEDVWPPAVKTGPWMGRPMMEAFGLPLPERRIGLSAHDFTQAFCAPAVYLTRARRCEGTPTVRSRWLMRLEALVRPRRDDPPQVAEMRQACVDRLRSADLWISWQRQLDLVSSGRPTILAPPAPRPPLAARPRDMSVTQVETWLRDPYAIFARYILRLRALDPIDDELGANTYGSFVHEALDAFVKTAPVSWTDDDALPRLLALGEAEIDRFRDRPGVRAFWWPRFQRIARWVVAQERQRDGVVRGRHSEIKGTLARPAPGGPFTLTAQADRIDELADGELAIIDYKTGLLPTKKEIEAGFAPQLPLEAAIALAGGFEGVPAAKVRELEFWKLRGNEAGGERKCFEEAGTAAEKALAMLDQLIQLYDEPTTTYPARPRPEFAPRYSDYEHLERLKEWSAGGEDDE